MKRKLLVLAPLLFASSAMAYEAPVVKDVPEQQKIEETKDVGFNSYFMDYEDVVDLGMNQLLPSYVAIKYLAPNSDLDQFGYEIEVGGAFKNIELNVGYRDFDINNEQLSQVRASLLFPALVSPDYIVQLGLSYARSELNNAKVKNDSMFVTVGTKALISPSIVAHASVDFEITDKNPEIAGLEIDIHESTTLKTGLSYNLTDSLAVGVDISFGSDFDKAYSVQASYKF